MTQGSNEEGNALDRAAALADEWFDEDAGVEHVVACKDYGCKVCVVIACATDLRAALRRP